MQAGVSRVSHQVRIISLTIAHTSTLMDDALGSYQATRHQVWNSSMRSGCYTPRRTHNTY